MAGAYPRLNRGAIRTKVREITSIEATTVVSDAHINNIINEELHKLLSLAEELEQQWYSSSITLTTAESGVTYRVPGWRFDNTTQFPTGLPGNFYLNLDSDLAPWNTTGNGQFKAGYYDNFLVYSSAARVLREVNDDTNRAADFDKEAGDIANLIIQQEYVAHSADQLQTIATNSVNYFLRLYFKALYLLKSPLSFDSDYGKLLIEINSAVTDTRNELIGKYKWSFAGTSYSDWDPYADIFAYGAAARLASRFGLSEAEKAELTFEYNSREEALVREKLQNISGTNQPGTLSAMRNQVMSLLNDYSKDIPNAVIDSLINSSYQQLALEHSWPWLTQSLTTSLPAGSSIISFSNIGVSFRILNAYQVTLDGNNEVTDANIIAPVPHILDGEQNESKYRYDITNGDFTVTPTPTENINISIRYMVDAPQLVNANDTPLFSARFNLYLVYRACYLASVLSDKAKKIAPIFAAEADNIKNAMYSYYMLTHSTEPFSIGENSLETRKYLPFFKAV